MCIRDSAWLLHMLRDSIGHKNFQKGIQSYYQRFMNANATTDDFREEMEKASGKDLKAFFSQWLYRPENPMIKGTWKYDGCLLYTSKPILHTRR